LLREFGVSATELTDSKGTEIVVSKRSSNPKNSGYEMFFTAFEFDMSGAFRRMGAWE